MSKKDPTYPQADKLPKDFLRFEFEEVRLVYQNKVKPQDRPAVHEPKDAYKIFMQIWDLNQIDLREECMMLLVDTQMRIMSYASISQGGYNTTIVDPKLIFSIALIRRGNGIILAHNHPSGNLKPSKPDVLLTEKLMQVGKALELPIHDHLIVTRDHFCSMMTEGHIPNI
ncbi:DNA repair protein [bacterium]|nr:DNA repair protein [bacterium]